MKSTAANRSDRLYVLDGMRLLAALMVVMYHYMARGGWETHIATVFPDRFRFASYGYLGVQFFFLLSGFVICMSAWGRPLKTFFVSRVIRLYPAYWFAVVATTVTVTVIPGGRRHLPWYDVLVNLTMLQQPLGVRSVDTVYWTLFAELRFYLLFALVAWFGLTYRRVVLFCCGWGAATILVAKAPPGPLRTLLVPEYSWFFIAGMAFYLMYRFRPNLLLYGIVAVSFCASLGPTVDEFEKLAFLGRRHVWPVGVALACMFGVVGLVATGRFARVRWRWLTVAGALTYPLYLMHQVIGWEVMFYLKAYDIDARVLVVSMAATMMLAAYLVHKFVETPLSRHLKRRLF
ncbi:acyltransferase family protein [Streptomyces litmocidini]|uniref:acyltransferase family protein n=1 Tax=Streptomyces litmocidini TaxID=67318 RepID=UPI001E319F6E|nr:acyltransferase [Streptomyces litmocidini]